VKFIPTPWPEEDFGKFFSGDSYIILNKYKLPDEEEWKYDAHFWIGSKSSQDEYGTAAYKTVELDTYLDDAAVQHREVQGHESELFKSYFNQLEIMEGGAESGFRHVKPEEYKPRLIRIVAEKKGEKATAREVPFTRKSVNSGDVFLLDFGKTLHQFNGKTCNMAEKRKAMLYITKLRSERGNPELIVIDEGQSTPREIEQFIGLLPEEELEDDEDDEDPNAVKTLYRLSDSSGELKVTKVAEVNINKGMLCTTDVFLLDTGSELFVWVGRGASMKEIRNAMPTGHKFLMTSKNPVRPIHCVKEKREGKDFYNAMY